MKIQIKISFLILFAGIMLVSCNPPSDGNREVLLSTSYGDIRIKLYEKTPQHSDNFMKLAKDGYFDSTLFHRVIEHFMIQGGDPDSRAAKPGIMLGNGGPAYTIPAEIVPEYIHKRGVLAAARESDDVNPLKASSGSQFYIVQGKVFNDKGLAAVEVKVEKRRGDEQSPETLRRTSHHRYTKPAQQPRPRPASAAETPRGSRRSN